MWADLSAPSSPSIACAAGGGKGCPTRVTTTRAGLQKGQKFPRTRGDGASEMAEVPLGSGSLVRLESPLLKEIRGTQLGNTGTKDVPLGGASKGWRASWLDLGHRGRGARNTLDSQVCTKGAGLGRAGTGTRQTSQAWLPSLHQPISPEVLPTPILTLTPSPAVLKEYSWHRWTTYLPGSSEAGRPASWRNGVPGLGRRKGWRWKSRGCLEAEAGEFRGVWTAAPGQNTAEGLSAPHYPAVILLGQPWAPPTPAGWS